MKNEQREGGVLVNFKKGLEGGEYVCKHVSYKDSLDRVDQLTRRLLDVQLMLGD